MKDIFDLDLASDDDGLDIQGKGAKTLNWYCGVTMLCGPSYATCMSVCKTMGDTCGTGECVAR